VDFLALLAHRPAAARVVPASAQGATIEPVLPIEAWEAKNGKKLEAVLVLDLVPVPLWDDVERAEGDDPQVGREVVDVAALETLFVPV
jgi:hypothetical protein